MHKYLTLEFRNAGLFRKHKDTKDKMFDMHGRNDRKDSQEFTEPITVNQISNMLHVLFGERPKPANREVLYDGNPYLYDKALSSYIKIDSYKNDKGQFYSETIQLKKSIGNAWSKQSYVTWERVNKLIESESLSKLFIDVLSEVFKCNIIDIPFNKVKEMILSTNDKRIDNMFSVLNESGKKPVFDSIYGKDNELTNINKNFRTQLTVLTGLDKITKLSGKILVPVSEEDILKIKSNKGCATLLDGGIVLISKAPARIFSTEGFTEVSSINLNKQ